MGFRIISYLISLKLKNYTNVMSYLHLYSHVIKHLPYPINSVLAHST